MRAEEQSLSIPTTSERKKVNEFDYRSQRSSALPPISVLCTQTALKKRQHIICRSLPPSQNFWDKKAKATIKVTRYEPSGKVLK